MIINTIDDFTRKVVSLALAACALFFISGCVGFPIYGTTVIEQNKAIGLNAKIPEAIDTSAAYFYNKDYSYKNLNVSVNEIGTLGYSGKKCVAYKNPSGVAEVYSVASRVIGLLPSYMRAQCELDVWYNNNKIARLKVNAGHVHIVGIWYLSAWAAMAYYGDVGLVKTQLRASDALKKAYPYLPLETRRKLYNTELEFVENELNDEQKKEYYAEKERERQRKLAAEEERKRRLAEKRERERQLRLAEQRERERLEYERRISVAFSGGVPTFSSWQKTLPYSGTSSGKALLDIKNRYEATATAYLQLADKQTQIPKVPQPELPPQVAVEQGKYESDKTFEERVQAAIDERNDKIVQLQERYQQQVAERNARIDALNQLQRQRQSQLEDNKIEFMADAMRAELVDFKVRNASFDQATALLYFDLYSTNSDYQELIAIETHDPVITERLAESPESIQPELTFRIEGDGFSLQQVTLKSGAVNEVAQVMVAKNVTSRGQQRVVIDSSKLEAASGITAVAGLQKQNPNIVDRFRTGVITYNNGKTERRDTGLDNDELWLAVQELRNSRLNDNAFLFVIGIEDYKSAAPVPYAENSALVTKELLRVKAGVPDKNVYLLTQDKTTGTQIRGELSNMLGRLDSDSLVYFYYAGHGVPDIRNNESVYLLPADAVQGAYQDDNFKLDNIMRQIAARQPQHAYFFLDTCFSGRVNRNDLLFPGVGALMVETIKPKVPENVTVFYGGQGTQFANAFEDKRHRLMSYYLAKGVLDGRDTISDLSNYVNIKVKIESLARGGDFRQEPFIDGATKGRLFRTAAAQ